MLRPLLTPIVLAAALVSCGAERTHTGVWQQVCDEAAPEPCDTPFVYELHLGHYGDQLTGLVVRNTFEDVALDPYQPTNECGCYFISGGRVRDDALSFTLFEPQVARIPDPRFEPTAGCAPAAAAIPPECTDRVFTLSPAGDALEGTVTCGGQTRSIRFQRVAGRPRTACVAVPEGDT